MHRKRMRDDGRQAAEPSVIHGITRRRFIGAMGALAFPSLTFGQGQTARVDLLAMGDWGAPMAPNKKEGLTADDVKRLGGFQNEVARAMADYAKAQASKQQPVTGVLALGDNFYGALTGPADKRFQDRFENLYSKVDLNVPFHFVIGNHDYEDAPKNSFQHQIAYARNTPGTRWSWTPADDKTWYTRNFPEQDPLVTAVVLNTNTEVKPDAWSEQVQFLRDGLQTAKGRWRIVVAHHPMWTDGAHYPDTIGKGTTDTGLYPKMRSTILPELKKVIFYVSGHDHNLQSIQHTQYPDTHFFISGAGGGDYPTPKPKRPSTDKVDYTSEFHGVLGFLHLTFTAEEASARFIGKAKETGKWGVVGKEITRSAV